MGEQVPTFYEASAEREEAAEGELDQGLKPISLVVGGVLDKMGLSLKVKDTPQFQPSPDAEPLPTKGKGSDGRKVLDKASKKGNRGGWQAKRGLTKDEVSKARAAAYAAHSALRGKRRLVAITINPPALDRETQSQRKRRLHRKASHVAQGFTRGREQDWIAMMIWQSPVDGRLHCHMLAWIDPEHDDVLARFCDGADTHAQPWDTDIGYFTRARLPIGPPDYEARQKWPRVNSNPIKGTRLSLSPRLRAILIEHQADQDQTTRLQAKSISLAKPFPIETMEEATGQFTLILGEPDNPVMAAERKRCAQGLRQEDLARAMGISRPQLANAKAGRYRLSAWAMARAAEFLKAA